MRPRTDEEFNDIIVSTISEVLDFSSVILNFLELNSSFKRGEIVECSASLSDGLRELFGDSGAIIEDLIATRVYDRLSLPRDQNKGSFEDRIKYAYDHFNGDKEKKAV